MVNHAESNKVSSLPSIGLLFSQSWQTFTQSILSLFILNVLGIVIFIGLAIIAILVFILSGAGSFLLKNGLQGITANLPAMTGPMMGIIVVVAIVLAIVSLMVGAALQIAAILLVDSKGKISLGDALKKSFRLVIPLFLVNILTSVLILGAFFVFILPVILFYFLLIFTQFEVVLDNQRWLKAIKRSVAIVSKDFGAILVRLVIIGLIYIAIVVVIPDLLGKIGPGTQFFVGIILFIVNLLLGWYILAYQLTLYKQARISLGSGEDKGIAWMWVVAIIGWLIAAGIFFASYKAISSGILNQAADALKSRQTLRTQSGDTYTVDSIIKAGEIKLASFNQLNEKKNKTSLEETQMKTFADEALGYFKQATQVAPRNAVVWYYLGETYSVLMRYEENLAYKAIDAFNSALALKPDDDLMYSGLAGVYVKTNDNANAIAVYQRGLKILPKNANLYHLLGIAYRKTGNINDAKKSFNAALDLLPLDDMKNRNIIEKELREI